jgi:uncharacterized protein with gpF-like domain
VLPNRYDILYALSLTPEEAVEYFESKGYAIAFSWREVFQEANNKAFAVAKMFKMDLLQFTRGVVGDFISGSISGKQAKASLKEEMIKAGWWGRMKAEDIPGAEGIPLPPSMKGEEVQLGSMHRIKTILRINNNTSMSAGRYKQMLANVKYRPYWQYIQLDRPTKRLSHAKLHLRVFMWDDPVWDKIWPPNGWGCLCYIKSLTEAEFKALGIKLSKGNEIDFTPEEGWAYNPGKVDFETDPSKYDADIIKAAS